MCAPQSGLLRDVHGVIQRRGRKETEGARRINEGIKRRETDPASSQPMSKEGWLPQEGLEELSHVEGQEGWW